jgi:DNA primase
MSAAVGNMVDGAYFTPDKALHLPIRHYATGDLMGWQTRRPGEHPLYTKGVHTRDAAPLTLRFGVDDPRYVLVTEGPTDAIAIVEYGVFPAVPVIACWSSGTIPPAAWWSRHVLSRALTVLAVGDGDKAGREFNQRIANVVGSAYEVRMPSGEDAKSIITGGGGPEWFERIVQAALEREPLRRVDPPKRRPAKMPIDMSGIDIVSLVESAGGVRRAVLSDGQMKFLCPLHDDRHDPSLTVDPKTGSWKCWSGCGAGGPAQFVMRWRSCDYRMAMSFLERWK